MSEVIFERYLLPNGSKNRISLIMQPRYITIHEVSLGLDKTHSSYNMAYYKEKIFNPPVGREHIGYHYLVSDKEIYQFIPDNERANHTGTFEGNNYSIGIERLVNEDVDFETAINVQAKLAATLAYKYSIPLTRIVPHSHWRQDTVCPSRMNAGQYGGWKYFSIRVTTYFQTSDFYTKILE